MRYFSRILLLGTLMLLSTPLTQAAETNPNNPSQQPEPGWSLWRPKSEIENAGFSAGFSNSELGGFMDFENSCAETLGTSTSETPYWFRLSNLLNQIGTGKVEFGCWSNGQFISTFKSTAVNTELENVDCLRVNVPTGEDLRVRSEPSLTAKVIGFVRNGATVQPDSFPASIVQEDELNWVAIRSPKEGWVSNDRPDSSGNLKLCR
ncbi:MAG: SH3 domain-containing protein [Cyanobacteriota bacterium]